MKCEPRILWSVGQTLLPEHLRKMEDSILADGAVRTSLGGLPCYGFSKVRFGSALESDGLFTIESGFVCMRSGRLLSVGENAKINSINLNSSGKSRLRVFVHLLQPEAKNNVAELLQSSEIPCWQWRLVLSLDEEVDGTLEYLHLGNLEKDINGCWSFSKDYIPPLLNVGHPGFLRSEIEGLLKSLEKYQKNLLETLANLQLSGENLIRARRCLIEVRYFSHFLSNLMSEVPLHPWELHTRLERFYLELSTYQNREPVIAGRPYQHANLSACILDPLNAVNTLLSHDREATPMAEFKLSEGVLQVELSDNCVSALSWFVLIQKSSIDTKVSMDSVKFASKTRLPIVHKYFLQGVVIKRVDRPLFQHYFGPEVEVWEIQKNDEWKEAVNEKSFAFLSESRFEGIKFFLYWSFV